MRGIVDFSADGVSKGKGIKKIKKKFVLTKMDETQNRLYDLFNLKDYISS